MRLIRELTWLSNEIVVAQEDYIYVCSKHVSELETDILIAEPMPDGIHCIRYAKRAHLADPKRGYYNVFFSDSLKRSNCFTWPAYDGHNLNQCVLFINACFRRHKCQYLF